MSLHALLVSNLPHRRAAVLELPCRLVRLAEALSIQDARLLLAQEPAFDVIAVDPTLPDGTWCTAYRELRALQPSALFLVIEHRHQRLACAEVTNRGGCFVLPRWESWRPLLEVLQSLAARKSPRMEPLATPAQPAHSSVA